MWAYVWPLLLIVASNTVYHIISKSTPANVNPFASLAVTYFIGAAAVLVFFFISPDGRKFTSAFKELNWTSFAMGAAIIGLEVGYIFLYRAGWNISVGSLVANISLAAALLIIGALFYKESLGLKQILGMVLCAGGLILINLK
ncbi:MAG: EamA family transporter [Clostridiales bacterium]|nr:EamA family transporter [Clostridiales bacterium]